MSEYIVYPDEKEWNALIEEYPLVLVDFWANWCGPCRMVGPVVEEIAQERPDVKVGKIDVDEQRELAAAFQIMSIPTLVVMQDGKVTQQVVGLRPKEQILAMLDRGN